MERHIGLDVHAASCTLAVISQAGKRLKDFPVEINGQALVEAVRMIPGEKHLVFEEGLQRPGSTRRSARTSRRSSSPGSARAGGRRAISATRMAWPRSCGRERSASGSSRPPDSSRDCASSRGLTSRGSQMEGWFPRSRRGEHTRLSLATRYGGRRTDSPDRAARSSSAAASAGSRATTLNSRTPAHAGADARMQAITGSTATSSCRPTPISAGSR